MSDTPKTYGRILCETLIAAQEKHCDDGWGGVAERHEMPKEREMCDEIAARAVIAAFVKRVRADAALLGGGEINTADAFGQAARDAGVVA